MLKIANKRAKKCYYNGKMQQMDFFSQYNKHFLDEKAKDRI